jgi:hypothetical protein
MRQSRIAHSGAVFPVMQVFFMGFAGILWGILQRTQIITFS